MITVESGLFLLLQAFSSGVAGYVTNKYAVNMIFKEYTPLKIGGAVKKNKEKFIEEISDLVERDIINSETIRNKVLGKEFESSIQNLGKNFCKQSLYETFGNKKIVEIPGWSDTIINGEGFLKDSLKDLLPKVIDNVCENVKLNDLLSDKQISSIIDYSYDEIIKNINLSEELKNLLSDLYEEEGDIYLNQLISKNSGEKITRIISCEIMNSIDELLDNKKETKLLVDKSLALIDIKSILKNLQKSIGSKSIEDLLSEEEFDKLSLTMYEKLDELIKSEEGIKQLENIVDEIFTSAKEVELTLFEILPVHFGRTSSEYIINLIKKTIPYLLSWIKDNQNKIENMIDESILESINNIDDDLRKSMISKVKDSMLIDFSSKNQIVDKLMTFLEEYEMNEETSYKLYSKVINFLEETKIKDLLVLLEKNNLISQEKIVEIILNKWREEGKKLSKTFLKREGSKTLNKLVDQDLNKLFNKNIKPRIYDLLSNNKSKIMSYLDKMIFNLVHDKIESILDSKIKDIFNNEKVNKISNIFPSKITNILNENNTYYKKNISKIISKKIKNIKLEDILKVNEEVIVNSISLIGEDFLKETIDKYKSYEVKDIISKINAKEDLVEEVSDKFYDNIKNNLSLIVDGRVKKIIYDNLIKLDEDEICNIAQSFMGKQLKPLSMFGAFLGVIVGIIFGITMQNINGAYGFYNNTVNTLIACGLMGIVGIMTNVIALWMIFRPYEQNKFIAKIPLFRIFSIGYIPSHKNSFASGMAQFIDEELLSGDRVVNSYNIHKKDFKNSIISTIKNSNYMIILDYITNKKNNICEKIYTNILKIVKKHNNELCSNLNNKFLHQKAGKLISLGFINNKLESSLKNINKFEDKIIGYLEGRLKNNKSLEEVLPKELMNIINNKIETDFNDYIYREMNNTYIEEFIKGIVIRNENAYSIFMNKSIKELVSEKSILNIQKGFKTDKFMNIILLELKEQLNNYLKDYLAEEFHEEKRFDELFNGKIKNKLDKDLYYFTDIVSKKLIEYIKSNNDMISSMVIKTVRKNLNFFIKMAYDFADGDGLVRDVVSIVTNNKLENLTKEDKEHMAEILYNCLEKEIYSSKIKDLGIKSTEINTGLLLDRLVFALKQNEAFKNNVYNMSDLITNSVFEIKIKSLGKVVGITNINHTYDKYKLVFNLVTNDIIKNLKNNKEEVNEFIKELIENKIMKYFYSTSLVEISWELNKEDYIYVINNSLNIINKSEVIKHHTMELCKSIYNLSIKNNELSSIFNQEILEKDIRRTINLSFENKDFNQKNKVIIDDLVDKLLDNKFEFISIDFKSYITEETIEAGLNTIEKNIIPMLRSLDLQSITLEEVDRMHPREIHYLFKSFAGDFFIKLYIYGAFGLIFGVNVYLSIILLIIDTIYTKKIDSEVSESRHKLFKE